LDHTVQQIFQSIKNSTEYDFKNKTVILISKWGLGGSLGQVQYKQKFHDDVQIDSDIFLTSFVPTQIIMYLDGSKETLKEKNPRTSSTKYCQPIHIQFQKETTDLIKKKRVLKP